VNSALWDGPPHTEASAWPQIVSGQTLHAVEQHAVERRAHSGAERKPAVLPRRAGREPFGELALAMLAEGGQDGSRSFRLPPERKTRLPIASWIAALQRLPD